MRKPTKAELYEQVEDLTELVESLQLDLSVFEAENSVLHDIVSEYEDVEVKDKV